MKTRHKKEIGRLKKRLPHNVKWVYEPFLNCDISIKMTLKTLRDRERDGKKNDKKRKDVKMLVDIYYKHFK